ncbi:nuclear transport factor 2 family protein [Salininema proteolyticum]|uniref:Nuclear transport factor 2 family protein n=1 Tax=Salininema proteolyticum TaxID=1607685 RepID=A0ABV8TY59_9ACTN
MEPTEPAVKAFIDAVNSGDRAAVYETLTDQFTVSDDGSERDARTWVDRNLIASKARLAVEDERNGGSRLMISIDDETWGHMDTYWDFTVNDGKVERFETGQASALSD